MIIICTVVLLRIGFALVLVGVAVRRASALHVTDGSASRLPIHRRERRLKWRQTHGPLRDSTFRTDAQRIGK